MIKIWDELFYIRNEIVYNFVSAIKKPEENKFLKKIKIRNKKFISACILKQSRLFTMIFFRMQLKS